MTAQIDYSKAIKNLSWRLYHLVVVPEPTNTQWIHARNVVGGQLFRALNAVLPPCEAFIGTVDYELTRGLCWGVYNLLNDPHSGLISWTVARASLGGGLRNELGVLLPAAELNSQAPVSTYHSGTYGIPYEQDTEIWFQFLKEAWVEDRIEAEVITRIRRAHSMRKAREIAMEFHERMLQS